MTGERFRTYLILVHPQQTGLLAGLALWCKGVGVPVLGDLGGVVLADDVGSALRGVLSPGADSLARRRVRNGNGGSGVGLV